MPPLTDSRFAGPGRTAIADEQPLVAQLLRPHFCGRNERLLLFSFAPNGRLLAASESSNCRSNWAALKPDMVRTALLAGRGSALLVAHNHPSGQPEPGEDDIVLTRQLAALCRMAGLMLCDHLILVRHGHFSFRAAGLI